MQSPAHFVVGAAICRYTRWRPAGLLLAFASHFVLDALPHFEDPSILPNGLSSSVAALWRPMLWLMALAVAPLALLVWHRARHERVWLATALYLIAGGLLACLPDALTILVGPHTFIWRWNQGAHAVWFPMYYRLLFAPYPGRLTIALTCLLVETCALLGGGWLLFRRSSRRRAADH